MLVNGKVGERMIYVVINSTDVKAIAVNLYFRGFIAVYPLNT